MTLIGPLGKEYCNYGTHYDITLQCGMQNCCITLHCINPNDSNRIESGWNEPDYLVIAFPWEFADMCRFIFIQTRASHRSVKHLARSCTHRHMHMHTHILIRMLLQMFARCHMAACSCMPMKIFNYLCLHARTMCMSMCD